MADERQTLIEEGELLAEGLSAAELEIYVAAGWVVPAQSAGVRRYLDVDVARIHLIHELRDDLALGDEAVPVVLQLIDELYGVRHTLLRLRAVLSHQPESVRRSIADALSHLPKD
jgi:chaperone modulatory protein CbpM